MDDFGVKVMFWTILFPLLVWVVILVGLGVYQNVH